MRWVVVVLYFASTAVANRSVVLCREADGRTAIEIVADHGQCLPGSAFRAEIDQADHPECRDSCCDSCPCEDSSLEIDPALVVKKVRPACEIFEINPDVVPWAAGRPCVHWQPTAPRPIECAAAVSKVTSRSLRTVVLLL